MGGGLMQLVAYGAQDIYLTGNPQITFFKVVYRRHTNFSCEAIEQTFNGSNGFGNTVTATISRNGDLVTNMYLQVDLPALKTYADDEQPFYTDEVGNALVKEVELEIGGQRIDKHYAEWLSIWSELNLNVSQKGQSVMNGYNSMVGKNPFTESGSNAPLRALARGNNTTVATDSNIQLYVPLRFWFNRNPGLALPLIALQYHEVKVKVTLNKLENLVRANTTAVTAATAVTRSGGAVEISPKLFVDYVYLDTDERRRFAQVSHEYLIEQLQEREETVAASSSSTQVDLNFNHPVKELVWVFVRADRATSGYTTSVTGNQPLNFEAKDNTDVVAVDHFSTATLKLNGHERFAPRNASYFRVVQPYQHHTSAPLRNVYVYSFALKPEEHQPSGTCNFSRIDNAQLDMTIGTDVVQAEALNLKIYAVNYNVLRIMSGMGGLAYSN